MIQYVQYDTWYSLIWKCVNQCATSWFQISVGTYKADSTYSTPITNVTTLYSLNYATITLTRKTSYKIYNAVSKINIVDKLCTPQVQYFKTTNTVTKHHSCLLKFPFNILWLCIPGSIVHDKWNVCILHCSQGTTQLPSIPICDHRIRAKESNCLGMLWYFSGPENK